MDPSTTPDELSFFREDVYFETDSTHTGVRIDTFLARHMSWRSRTSVKKLIQEGKVTFRRKGVEVVASKGSTTVLEGDMIYVKLPKPKRDLDFDQEGCELDLQVIHEDRWLLALSKPPNVSVHPAGRNLFRTVITALHKHYRHPGDPLRDIVPKLCHRLDLETSGVLLVAKDDSAHRKVMKMIRDRIPKKEYLAITYGTPSPPTGLIDLPIGPTLSRRVHTSCDIRADGQEARTSYRVVSSFGDYALVRLDLHTGRHHQIRLHLSAIGHPIVGDKIYGKDEELFLKYYENALTDEDWERLELRRHALHAWRFSIPHPITGEPMVFSAPLPDDLSEFVTRHGGTIESSSSTLRLLGREPNPIAENLP